MTKTLFLILGLLLLPGVVGSTEHSAKELDQILRTVEISGISMATPQESIAEILAAQGYTPVRSTLYTKQEQLQKSRKTIYRIEIEETAAFRQISYHRSLSGGRVKSSVGEDPIPSDDLDTAQKLYQIICEVVPETIKAERQCEPLEQTAISINYGNFVDINARWAVQLNATAGNTAFGIKYSYE